MSSNVYKNYLEKEIPRRTEYRLKSEIKNQHNNLVETGDDSGSLSSDTNESLTAINLSVQKESDFSNSDIEREPLNVVDGVFNLNKRRRVDNDGVQGTSSESLPSHATGQNSDTKSTSDEENSEISSNLSFSDYSESNYNRNSNDLDDDIDIEEENPCNLDEKLYSEANVSLKQTLLLIMAFIVRFKLSKECTSALMKLLSIILPDTSKLPSTLYLFYKHFESEKTQFVLHLYCLTCKAYIGIFNSECKFCKTICSVEGALKNGNYFLVFSIKEQILSILRKRDQDSENIKNINSFNLKSRSMYKRLPMRGNDISITWNTDGVPIFHSSNFGIWPLLYVVNEIESSKKVQMAALWFGEGKPDFNSFLKPFVDEMNRLSSTGLAYNHNGKEYKIRVFPGACTCDAVARCCIQNITQYNGKYGCSWCLNEGKSVKTGNGHCRIYEFKESNQRDILQMKNDARTVVLNGNGSKPVNGVKGFSILSLLNHFDVVRGFAVDYMHCVCQGVVKSVMGLWMDSANYQKPFYLKGKARKEIDTQLLAIKPPDEITRTPRSVDDRKQWKANEWRSWLLFYSPVVLKGHLPEKYFNHWLNLVVGIAILLSTNLTSEMIEEAAGYLSTFVQKFSRLYGIETMSYNIHQLLHIHETAENWGPLWSVSCFQFENMNGKLLKLYNGTQKVPQQIAEKISILSKIEELSQHAFDEIPLLKDFTRDLLKGYILLKSTKSASAQTFTHSLPKNTELSIEEKIALEMLLQRDVTLLKIYKYNKMTVDGVKFSNKSTMKRNNSGVKLKNEVLGFVKGFYSVNSCACVGLCACKENFYVIVKTLVRCITGHMSGKRLIAVKKTNQLMAMPVTDIIGKIVILSDIGCNGMGKKFVAELPNLIECD